MSHRPTPEERQQIEDLLAKDVDNLFAELAPPQRDLFPDVSVLVMAGQQEFEARRQLLYQRLCVDESLCKRIENPQLNDKVNLVVAIGDILATAVVGVPPLVLATLILKMGVRHFCNCSK